MVSYSILSFFLLFGVVIGGPFKSFNDHFNSLIDHISTVEKFSPKFTTESPDDEIWSESSIESASESPNERMSVEHIMEAKEVLGTCVKEALTNKSSKYYIDDFGLDLMFHAIVYCASENNVPDVALMFNSLLFVKNTTETDWQCIEEFTDEVHAASQHIESFGKNMTKKERNTFCQITNDLSKTICSMRKECGRSDSVDAIGVFAYAKFHFDANNGVENSNDCPYESSEMGKVINPKLFGPNFDFTNDALFTSDFCENSMDYTTSSNEIEDFKSTTQGE